MKKLFPLLISAILLIISPDKTFAMTQVTNTEGGLYVVNCEEYISLRTYPSTEAPVLTTIPLGDMVYVLDDSVGTDTFAHVNYRGKNGYALYSYLSPHATLYKVINCRQSISLRSDPSTSATAMRQIPLGQYVRFVRDVSNGFYYVYYEGMLGYALADYLG